MDSLFQRFSEDSAFGSSAAVLKFLDCISGRFDAILQLTRAILGQGATYLSALPSIIKILSIK
uniref:Uncharacterized protein n=1 Tax=Megaselia scalaris TaxID=36166 RepID=T1GWD0_MEGSC